MINQTVQDIINEQIKHELSSAYVYLSMSAYFESNDLPGFARWMRVQSQEELNHAMKFFDFLNERNGEVKLQPIDQPPLSYTSAEEVFQKALEHEQFISSKIHQIYKLAVEKEDYPTQVMLHWFIEEQVEEEQSVGQVLEMVRKAEGRDWALLILDNQVGKRQDEH
jgi:ferritin